MQWHSSHKPAHHPLSVKPDVTSATEEKCVLNPHLSTPQLSLAGKGPWEETVGSPLACTPPPYLPFYLKPQMSWPKSFWGVPCLHVLSCLMSTRDVPPYSDLGSEDLNSGPHIYPQSHLFSPKSYSFHVRVQTVKG